MVFDAIEVDYHVWQVVDEEGVTWGTIALDDGNGCGPLIVDKDDVPVHSTDPWWSYLTFDCDDLLSALAGENSWQDICSEELCELITLVHKAEEEKDDC